MNEYATAIRGLVAIQGKSQLFNSPISSVDYTPVMFPSNMPLFSNTFTRFTHSPRRNSPQIIRIRCLDCGARTSPVGIKFKTATVLRLVPLRCPTSTISAVVANDEWHDRHSDDPFDPVDEFLFSPPSRSQE